MRFAERLAPGASTWSWPIRPTAWITPPRLVALFRRHPFGAFFRSSIEPSSSLDGDDTRRYGDTAITFCYAP